MMIGIGMPIAQSKMPFILSSSSALQKRVSLRNPHQSEPGGTAVVPAMRHGVILSGISGSKDAR